jgi:hypothetical protein
MEFCDVSDMEYVLPLHANALLFLACKIPVANPAIIIVLPTGENKACRNPKANPFFASRMLPR